MTIYKKLIAYIERDPHIKQKTKKKLNFNLKTVNLLTTDLNKVI